MKAAAKGIVQTTDTMVTAVGEPGDGTLSVELQQHTTGTASGARRRLGRVRQPAATRRRALARRCGIGWRRASISSGSATASPPGAPMPPSSRAIGWGRRCDRPRRGARRRAAARRRRRRSTRWGAGCCSPGAAPRRPPRRSRSPPPSSSAGRAAPSARGPGRSRSRPLVADERVVVLPASADGRDLAPRLAQLLGRPLLASAIAIAPDCVTVVRAGGPRAGGRRVRRALRRHAATGQPGHRRRPGPGAPQCGSRRPRSPPAHPTPSHWRLSPAGPGHDRAGRGQADHGRRGRPGHAGRHGRAGPHRRRPRVRRSAPPGWWPTPVGSTSAADRDDRGGGRPRSLRGRRHLRGGPARERPRPPARRRGGQPRSELSDDGAGRPGHS